MAPPVATDQLEASDEKNQAHATACTECQRRKQKCNREWPCNRCQKRKVADQCRFTNEHASGDGWNPSVQITRKRERNHEDGPSPDFDMPDDGEGLEAIGYGTQHLLASLGEAVEARNKATALPEQYAMHSNASPQLQRALKTLPSRSLIDALVQHFLDTVNFYYYIAYPPKFMVEYHQWWTDRTENRPLGVPWTCLLIMVCACSVQHATEELKENLEAELGKNVKHLTDDFHNAARELHSAIPVGHSHIYTVQYLLHSCYWFKAEARFVECWHVLGSAIREGQMLGLHQDSATASLSDFDREMWRRLWCILDAWDWLVSALLQRPMLIDRTDCDAEQPALTLEGYPTPPLLHIRLQSILVGKIFKRFGPPKNIQTMDDIKDYVDILESWMATFPPEFYFDKPDISHEAKYPWIALHRHYLHTTALSMSLGPMRLFMAKHMTKASNPELELKFRSDGVDYALGLMQAVHRFFEYVWTRDTTFHFVPFCIFDTAALLCSAILHDDDGSIPRRQNIIDAIDLALDSLRRLSTATNTAKTPYDILRRLSVKIRPDRGDTAGRVGPSKRHKPDGPCASLPAPGSSYAKESPDIAVHPEGVAQPVAYGQLPASQDHGMSFASGTSTTSTLDYADAAADPPMHYQTSMEPQQVVDVPQQLVDAGQTFDVTQPRTVDTATGGMSIPSTGFLDMPAQTPAGTVDNGTYATMPEAHLGDLAELWNWQSLDLAFSENPMLWRGD